MLAPTSSASTSIPSSGIFAVSLTDPSFTPESRVWAADPAITTDIPAGSVFGLYTSGPNTGKVGIYDNAASDGRQTAVGIIANTISADIASSQDMTITLYTSGKFKTAALVGLDSDAISDLSASDSNGVVQF